MKFNLSSRCDLHRIAELLNPMDQTIGGLGRVSAVKVSCTQIVPFGPVAQPMGGGERRGGHAHDGFLGPAPSAQSVELHLQATTPDLDGHPGRLHQGSLESLVALARSGTAAFANVLVVARTPIGLGQQMDPRGKARHVYADLGDDHACADIALAGCGSQRHGGLSKCLKPQANLFLRLGSGLVQGVNVAQMQLEHEAVVCADVFAQSFEHVSPIGLDATIHAGGRSPLIGLTIDERLQRGASTLAEDIAEHDAQLEVDIFQSLQCVGRERSSRAHKLFAGGCVTAQLPPRLGPHNAGR